MRKAICLVLMMIFISGVNAQTINLNEPVEEENEFTQVIKTINSYEVIGDVARHYETIQIHHNNESVVLEFNETSVTHIRESSQENVDLELNISQEDILYLYSNWKTMSSFDKLMFLIKEDIPLKDVMILGSIATSIRN